MKTTDWKFDFSVLPRWNYRNSILIIDTSKNVFSYIETKNYNPCYKVVELNEDVFGIEADKSQRQDKRLNALSKKRYG